MTSPGSAATLRVEDISVSLAGRRIIERVDLAVRSGELVGVLGRNGSGKSTLLRTVYRAIRPDGGRVTVDDRDLWAMPVRQAARLRSVVTQLPPNTPTLTVAETVLVGRTSIQPTFGRTSAADRDAVADALRAVGMAWAAERMVGTLSGGERQRVLIARALAQQAPFVVLDEPTNHLDVNSALEVLELLVGLGVGALAALHDLSHAAAYCHQVVILAAGRVIAAGPPATVLTDEVIRRAFGVRALVGTNPLSGRLSIQVAPLSEQEPQKDVLTDG